jgi:hypothetical protein
MNIEKSSKPPVSNSGDQISKTVSIEEVTALGTPMGTFGGSADFVVRIRNGKPVASNVGSQGGGQN